MEHLLKQITQCRVCKAHLPLGPRPVVSASTASKIIIVGQAPGLAVHNSGIPWDDKSGDNLRQWMQMDKPTFYDPKQVALIPMAFCYPGRGKSGDLPPRKECAPLWHQQLLKHMNEVKLVILVGRYAQSYYLGDQSKPTLTETVKCFGEYLPRYFVLPHPSPRNNIWQTKSEWFGKEVIPRLQAEIRKALAK